MSRSYHPPPNWQNMALSAILHKKTGYKQTMEDFHEELFGVKCPDGSLPNIGTVKSRLNTLVEKYRLADDYATKKMTKSATSEGGGFETLEQLRDEFLSLPPNTRGVAKKKPALSCPGHESGDIQEEEHMTG
jgi:hypothetical protein